MLSALSVKIQRAFHIPAFQILLVILSGGLVYSNTFDVPFVLDDYHVIVDNKKLADFSTFLASDLFPNPRWIALATFALNRTLANLNLAGFHAVNLLIHLAAGIVVYFLTKTIISSFGDVSVRRFAAAPVIASLGFVLHPLHTQSVTYIVQRMTSLASLLYLLAVLLYAKAFHVGASTNASDRSRRYILYGIAIVSCLLAMGTKEISFTLPIVLALYDFCFLAGTVRERIQRLVPFFVCALVLSLYLVGMEKGFNVLSHGGGDDVSYPPPHLTYIITEISVLCTYLRLLILPVGQNLDYDYPFFSTILHPQVAAALVLITALLGGGIFLLKKSFSSNCKSPELIRVGGFAIAWFFITISVESALVPLIDTIFEHRVYLPSVLFFIFFGMIACVLNQSFGSGKQIVFLAVFLLLGLAGYATYQRNHVWRDTATLWTDVVRKSPNKVRGWASLGIHYVNKLDPARAIPLLEHAVSINPDYYPAHTWLARALVQSGDRNRALTHYLIVTKIAPNFSKAWEAAGRLYLENGQVNESIYFLNRALELDPDSFISQGHLQKALMKSVR